MIKTEASLIIKPRNNRKNDKPKADLNNNMNSKSLKISKFLCINDDAVVCCGDDGRKGLNQLLRLQCRIYNGI